MHGEKILKCARVLAALSIVLLPQLAHAFSELVRHNYVNCNTCHISPSGGGVLTPYGKALSEEILSTWVSEGESAFAYGVVDLPKWLMVGGDVRLIQTLVDTPTFVEAKLILMQADVEVAVKVDRYTAVAKVGAYAGNVQTRGHYLMANLTDELSVRAGKFKHAFGIRVPEHVISTKRGLGWDDIGSGSETYNIEGAWLGENMSLIGSVIFGRPDSSSLKREAGLALRPSLSLGEGYQFGMSYFLGSQGGNTRHLFGPYGILGFTEHFFLLSELDFQLKASTLGLVTYQRLDYEPWRGIHTYLTYELTSLDPTTETTKAMGLGIQFFPRPHFEISAQWQKVQGPTYPGVWIDSAWIMGHYYL